MSTHSVGYQHTGFFINSIQLKPSDAKNEDHFWSYLYQTVDHRRESYNKFHSDKAKVEFPVLLLLVFLGIVTFFFPKTSRLFDFFSSYPSSKVRKTLIWVLGWSRLCDSRDALILRNALRDHSVFVRMAALRTILKRAPEFKDLGIEQLSSEIVFIAMQDPDCWYFLNRYLLTLDEDLYAFLMKMFRTHLGKNNKINTLRLSEPYNKPLDFFQTRLVDVARCTANAVPIEIFLFAIVRLFKFVLTKENFPTVEVSNVRLEMLKIINAHLSLAKRVDKNCKRYFCDEMLLIVLSSSSRKERELILSLTSQLED